MKTIDEKPVGRAYRPGDAAIAMVEQASSLFVTAPARCRCHRLNRKVFS